MNVDCYCRIGYGENDCLEPDDLVAQMDTAGVDAALVSAHERYQAVYNKKGNDLLIDAASRYPGKLLPTCSVNPWFGQEALGEFRRCVHAGARMLVLNPMCQGISIDDELVDPLAQEASRLRIPIYVHTPQQATPFQLAVMAKKYPDIPWIMGHAGATDYWYDVPLAASLSENIYIESSFARPFAFNSHCSQAGFSRGIMGSAAPLSSLAFEWRHMQEVISPEAYPGIYGDTLLSLISMGRDRS